MWPLLHVFIHFLKILMEKQYFICLDLCILRVLKISIKELLLQHKDQRESISSHSYFFRCFLFWNVIFFFSKWCPEWKSDLYLNICIIFLSLFKKLCAQTFYGQSTLITKLEQKFRNCIPVIWGNVFKIKNKNQKLFPRRSSVHCIRMGYSDSESVAMVTNLGALWAL